MKSKLYKSAVLLVLVALVGAVAFFGWPHYLKYAEDTTLAAVRRHSREITAVEVLHLSDTEENGPSGSYLVRYDNSRRGIIARRTITGSQVAELVRLWGQVRFAEGYQAGCHEPGFVLHFLAGQRSIFEVAVCFECDNVSWQSAPFTTSCRQIYPKSIDKKSGADGLNAFLTSSSFFNQ